MWGFWVKSFSGGLILKVSDRKSLRFGQSSKRVALRAVLIHVPNKKKSQKTDLCLNFDCLFDQLLPVIIFLFALFYLSGSWRLKLISEHSNKSRLSEGCASTKLHKDRLQMFKVGGATRWMLNAEYPKRARQTTRPRSHKMKSGRPKPFKRATSTWMRWEASREREYLAANEKS